ncbi:MAG TPA: hypothetical protein EYH56_03730 [Nanoarchaeota archaeon]|nr:hypothetical protein [Nanoarchaeota archaeon]
MGPCFSALYLAEIILHELSHWVEDEYLKRNKPELNIKREKAIRKEAKRIYPFIEKLEDSPVYFLFTDKIRHDLTNSLPVYVLYPETKSKLEKYYDCWKSMFEIHKELFGDLKKQRRKIHKNIRKSEKIFEEDFENINTSFILIRNIAET